MPLTALLNRVLPALLMAVSVALLAAGILSFAAPVPAAGPSASATAIAGVSEAPSGAPSESAPATPGESGLGSVPPGSPDPSASAALGTSGAPSASASVGPSAGSPSVPVTVSPSPPPPAAVATRIVISSMRIDLPVISGDTTLPGNPNHYPLCDVAQYLESYGQPGEPGAAYIYAHAREGMFLPLLEGSQRRNGREMIGALVEVYTEDNRLHVYTIYRVKRHATDLRLANDVPPGQHILVLQTSEGPRGTIPKLQVAARPLSVVPADPAAAHPEPRPRACFNE